MFLKIAAYVLKATSQLFYLLGFHSRDLDMHGLKLHSTTDTVAVKDRCDVTLWLVLKWGDKPERRPPRTGPQTHWCSGSWALSVNRLTKQQSEISKAATTPSVWVPSGRKRDSTKNWDAQSCTCNLQRPICILFYIFLPWSLTGLTGLVSVCPVFWPLHDSRQGPAVLTSGSCSLHPLLMLLFSGLEATLDSARVRND